MFSGGRERKPLNRYLRDEKEEPTGFVKRSSGIKKSKNFGRYPEVFIGLALIVVGIVFSFLFSGNTSPKGVDILVLSEEIKKDEVLKSSQLVSARIQSEDSIQLLSPNQSGVVVGKKALIDLPARAPVLQGYFSSSPSISAQHVLAGLRLKVGEYPTTNLRAGDFVDVVSASAEFAPLSQVEVYSVVLLSEGQGADFFVTLIILEVLEQAFVNLIKDGDIRLFINPVL